jgi:hypothetical protein
VSYVTIVFYDKVRGRNKAQRWLLLVCCGFFIWKRYNRTHFHRTILYGLHNHSVLCWLLYIISIDHYSEVSDMVMVFNATFNYISVISWRSILLMEDTGVPVKHHRPTASHWQTLLHNTSRLSRIRIHNVSGDIHWLYSDDPLPLFNNYIDVYINDKKQQNNWRKTRLKLFFLKSISKAHLYQRVMTANEQLVTL